jgi:hypothetical protein
MSEPAPTPASAAGVTCPRCGTQLPSYDPDHSRFFGCPKCRTFFWANALSSARPAQRLDGFRKALEPGPSLPLGAVVELGGYRCRLTGYQVRGEKNDRLAEWREYQLRPAEPLAGDDPADFPLQLAEYQGHWLLIRRAWHYPGVRGAKPFRDKKWHDDKTGRTYRLWHRYQPLIRDAVGEFDWNILNDEKLYVQEFTAPPYLLSSEQRPGEGPIWYLAEYLEPQQVQAVFRLAPADLPDRHGIGAAQPASVPGWPELRALALFTFLALGILHMLLLGLRPSHALSEEIFSAAASPTGTSQMQTSRSFTLAAPAALNVTLAAPDLANHWVEVTASLVNEQTGRGYEFTRSLEFYEGTEDGEHWTEGSRSAAAVLSAVPAGRYHFNLYPTADQGTPPTSLRLEIEENPPLWSNFFLVLGLLAVVPAVAAWRRAAFERERWENSDFGPSDATD